MPTTPWLCQLRRYANYPMGGGMCRVHVRIVCMFQTFQIVYRSRHRGLCGPEVPPGHNFKLFSASGLNIAEIRSKSLF